MFVLPPVMWPVLQPVKWPARCGLMGGVTSETVVRLRPHQCFKISNVTARRLQYSKAMYYIKYLKASPKFKSYLLPCVACAAACAVACALACSAACCGHCCRLRAAASAAACAVACALWSVLRPELCGLRLVASAAFCICTLYCNLRAVANAAACFGHCCRLRAAAFPMLPVLQLARCN